MNLSRRRHKIRFIPEKYHPIISSDIQDENLEHDEMIEFIFRIQNRGCIGYCLVCAYRQKFKCFKFLLYLI